MEKLKNRLQYGNVKSAAESKRPDKSRAANQGGNPRYRLDSVSLVSDLLPLNRGFYVSGRLLSVSDCMVCADG
jgi:hypothetical protein